MDIFVAVLIVMAIMLYFMVVTLRTVVTNAGKHVNRYFLTKLREFDEDFKVKTDEIERLNVERDTLAREVRSLQNDLISFKTSPFYAPRPLARSVYIPVARYIDNNFFEEYKSAKDMLKMDKVSIIKDLIEKVPYTGNKDLYEVANSIMNKLNFEALYDFCSIQPLEQLEIMDECFDETERAYLVSYLMSLQEPEKFDCMEFITHLKHLIKINDPKLYVRIGEKSENYDFVDTNVVSQFDDNVCEGIKIIYQNKVYDYSIYKSRKRVGK